MVGPLEGQSEAGVGHIAGITARVRRTSASALTATETLYVIADRLAQPDGRWRPMHHPKTDSQDLEDAAASR